MKQKNFLELNSDNTFKILIAADLHTDTSEEDTQRTWTDIRHYIQLSNPNLLILLGDIWCADDKPERGAQQMTRDLQILASLNVPWAFVWGNHDYGLDTDLANYLIANTPNSLMPFPSTRGNYRIELRSHSTNQPVWDLFFLNSHGWALEDPDLEWLEKESKTLFKKRMKKIPSLIFFHIPLQQYEDARIQKTYQGEAHETVAFWGNDHTKLPKILKLGSILACFVGHSHSNDYYFIYQNTLFAYARATGYGGYGGELLRKGAKLIMLESQPEKLTLSTLFTDSSTPPYTFVPKVEFTQSGKES